MMRPACWRCGSTETIVGAVTYTPTYHEESKCTCAEAPCGLAAGATVRCRACGNEWFDGAINEFLATEN